jgi:hypothetical protein
MRSDHDYSDRGRRCATLVRSPISKAVIVTRRAQLTTPRRSRWVVRRLLLTSLLDCGCGLERCRYTLGLLTATNNGTANLTNVTVSDDLTGANPVGPLAPATCVLTTDHTVTAADLRGTITQSGTGDGDQTGPAEDPETVVVPPADVTSLRQLA